MQHPAPCPPCCLSSFFYNSRTTQRHTWQLPRASWPKARKKATNGDETVAGYFRKIFEEEPKLLKGRSNDELLQRWLTDHPGEKEVPKSVKTGLANIKSVLRKKGRKGRGKPKATETDLQDVQGSTSAHGIAPSHSRGRDEEDKGLQQLEEQIDDCLSLAKQRDREGLSQVISLLRSARNAVVWKMGAG